MTECIKIISFNLRADFKHDKLNRWDFRKEYAMKLIRDSGATIIGVQELLPKMRMDVQSLLDNYTVLGWGRYHGTKPGGDEHSDIIIKNDDADVDFYKTFWLSKNNDEVSRAYYAFFPRICTVAEVYVKALGQRVRVFNTHFDHICGMARVLGVNIILRTMSELNEEQPMPTILMGDMNASPKSRPIRILRENLHPYSNIHLSDAYSSCKPESIRNTHHGFKQTAGLLTKLIDRAPIDYIFVSDEFKVLDVYADHSSDNGRFPSDHFPIVATLQFNN